MHGFFGGGCGTGFGGDCTWIILLILILCCCCGGTGMGKECGTGFGFGGDSCWLIVLILILCCCCGGGQGFGYGPGYCK